MKSIQYSTDEVVHYDYRVESDELEVRIASAHYDTDEERLEEHPNISLRRDRHSGELVGLRVEGVQDLILQHLVRDLVSLAKSYDRGPVQVEEDQQPPTAEENNRHRGPDARSRQGSAAEQGEARQDSSIRSAADVGKGEKARQPADRTRERSAETANRGDNRGGVAANNEPAPAEPSAGNTVTADEKAPANAEEDKARAAGREHTETSKRRRQRRRKKQNRTGEGQDHSTDRSRITADASEQADAGEAETDRSQGKKRRRRGRGSKREPDTAGTPEAVSASAETHGTQKKSYKTEPIPGLEIPEAFRFEGMHPLLGKAIAAMGFDEPTPIQRRAVPAGIEGQDLIGLAQTGTGKTLAFLVPGMNLLLQGERSDNLPRMLVLTPTRELAGQVAEEAKYLATHTDLRITTVYGGVGLRPQYKELQRGTDLIVATPGRLLDHLNRKNVKLSDIEVLVLDEADRMLDMGFMPEVRSILRRLPTKRQTMLFSATMPPAIQNLSMEFQQEPELIEVARQLPPASIVQQFYPVEKHLKTPLLIHLLHQDESMRSVLVFTERKSEADILARKLRESGVELAVMHGDRSQRERESALRSLSEGRVRVLVATDVAARGLDVTGITHVVNYDMPQSVDDYVHRIGRTARGDAKGKAYTFVSLGDEAIAVRIESALERDLDRVYDEAFNYDVPAPSWAKPSAQDITASLHKPKGLAERFRRMMRR